MGGKNGFRQYSAIVTIEPDSKRSYEFKNNKIQPAKLTKFKKDIFYISIVSSRDLIMDSIEISRHIPDEDIDSAIELQVYDELNLDPALQYTIFYKEFFGFESQSKRKFNIFVVEVDKLKHKFKDIIKKVKYIDYILPEPFVIKSVYDINILEKDSIDCFIYFKKSDAFLAIYLNGEYLYSKSLNYTIGKMYEKFCELVGENYKYDDFTNLLTTGHSINISKESKSFLENIYKEMFIYIKDVIFYAKRAYNIEDIDNIYLNSSLGVLKDIDKQIKKYLNIASKELNLVLVKNFKEVSFEQLHNLMMLSAVKYIEEPDESLNFSIFKRVLPFRKRAVGKIFYIFLLSLMLSLAYPIYKFGYGYILNLQLIKLKKEELKLYKESSNIKNQLLKLDKEHKKIEVKLQKVLAKLNFRERLLEQIYKKKISYPMKSKMLVDIFNKIDKYKTKIYDIQLDTKENGDIAMNISIFSSNDKNITELLKALAKMKKYNVKTKEIKRDDDKRIYLSDIEVVLNDID